MAPASPGTDSAPRQATAERGTLCPSSTCHEGAVLISDSVNADKTPPRCGIRAACRWFAQDGPRACGVCPLVVYRPTSGTP